MKDAQTYRNKFVLLLGCDETELSTRVRFKQRIHHLILTSPQSRLHFGIQTNHLVCYKMCSQIVPSSLY